MIKRAFMILFLIILCSSFASAGLGISPAIKKIDFIPNEEYTFHFNVYADNPNQVLDVYLGGDLAGYATTDKEQLVGGGSFNLNLKLPEYVRTPGRNRISVGVKEVPSQGGFIGGAIDLSAAIDIYVPYPGKYIEGHIEVPNTNVNEEVPVTIKLINRGKEAVDITTRVNFYEKFEESGIGAKIHTMELPEVTLASTEEKVFEKYLYPTAYLPGVYYAEAEVNYAGESKTFNDTFRIGYLFVNITNFTTSLEKKGLERFYVYAESSWNDYLEGVYADVNIYNEEANTSFRTPSISISPWKKAVLEGYVDTKNLVEGFYDIDVVLNYRNNKTIAYGRLVLNEPISLGYTIGAGLAIVSIILLLIFWIYSEQVLEKISEWSGQKNKKPALKKESFHIKK